MKQALLFLAVFVLPAARADLSIDQLIEKNLVDARSASLSAEQILGAAQTVYVLREAKVICQYADNKDFCIDKAIILKSDDLKVLCASATGTRKKDCQKEADAATQGLTFAAWECSKQVEVVKAISNGPNGTAKTSGLQSLLDKMGIPKDRKAALTCARVVLHQSDEREAGRSRKASASTDKTVTP